MVIERTSHAKLFATLILLCCLLAVAYGQTPREVAKRTLPSVVLIIGENNKGKAISLGSGFFVRGDVVATNNHVIGNASRLYAKTKDNNKLYPLKLIVARPRTDLALLKITGISRQSLLLADFRGVEVGDEVYAVGNPAGLEGTFTQGLVSGLRKAKDIDYLQISAPISKGSSGGPILDKFGGVIGVAVGVIGTNGNLNFAIPVSELASLMRVLPEEDSFDFSGLLDNQSKTITAPDSPDWKFIFYDGDKIFFLHKKSIRLEEGIKKAYVREVQPTDADKYDFNDTEVLQRPYVLAVYEIDCKNQRTRVTATFEMNSAKIKSPMRTYRLPRWFDIEPFTAASQILWEICKE
jgi:S1-C subfamily serine protease